MNSLFFYYLKVKGRFVYAFASFSPRLAKNKSDNLSPQPGVKQSSVRFRVHKAERRFRMRSGSFEKERVFHQNVIGMPSCEHSGPLFAQRANPRGWQESICSLLIISGVLFRRRTKYCNIKYLQSGGAMSSVISLQSCYFCLGPAQRLDSETTCILKLHATLRRSRRIALTLIGGFASVRNPNVPLFSDI